MNRISILPLDPFYNVCLFLDPKDLANFSVVDRTRHFLLKDAASWDSSELKPQQALTVNDKMIGLFQSCLENLKVGQPSRFCITSQDKKTQFKICVFCSKGDPVLPIRDFASRWQAPIQSKPSNRASYFHFGSSTDRLPQQAELNMAWAYYSCIEGVLEPQKIPLLGDRPDPNQSLMGFLGRAIEQRFDQLKAQEERDLFQRFQGAENPAQFIATHNAGLMNSETLGKHLEQGALLALKGTYRSTTWKVAMIFAALSLAVGLQFR